MNKTFFGKVITVLALLGFATGVTLFAQKQTDTAANQIANQQGMANFKMSEVIGYGLVGAWELDESGTDTMFYPVGDGAHHVVVFTSRDGNQQAIRINHSEALLVSEKQLQVFGDPTISNNRIADLLDADALLGIDINIYAYNEDHIVAHHFSGDCWETTDDGNTANCSKTGEKGCTWSVEVSTGNCYKHTVACPDREGQITGFVKNVTTNDGTTYFRTNMPRTKIDCADM